jgi:transposase
MEVIHTRCAGLDVHKQTVVACLRMQEGQGVRREVRRFATTTRALLQLADWLRETGCTQVAMEASGVYWKPAWHMLEGEFELVLANPAHIRNVPGRKSDFNDAQWIADLLAHGLIRSSFVPPGPIQELRDLTRTRKQLIREATQHKQRIQKVLEDANVKLAAVVSDISGESGRRILRALVAGEADPNRLAELGSKRLAASPATLAEALQGRVTAHHRFLLGQHLKTLEQLETTVAEFEAQIEAALEPFRAAVERLSAIPGGKHDRRAGDHRRDWLRYEPLPQRRPSQILGRSRSTAERECGQDTLAQAAQRGAVAQDHAGPMRVGGDPQPGQLSPCAVPAAAGPPRS